MQLTRITKGKPERVRHTVRNDDGSCDLRVRPMWREWTATVSVQFDADMLSPADVVNLLHRAGMQIGIGEGRPYSRDGGAGMGWGTFKVLA